MGPSEPTKPPTPCVCGSGCGCGVDDHCRATGCRESQPAADVASIEPVTRKAIENRPLERAIKQSRRREAFGRQRPGRGR